MSAATLVAKLEAAGVESESLDDLIHDAFAEDAASVNNGGLHAQVEELIQRYGIEGAKIHVGEIVAAEGGQS
jgi:hypothetical protein